MSTRTNTNTNTNTNTKKKKDDLPVVVVAVRSPRLQMLHAESSEILRRALLESSHDDDDDNDDGGGDDSSQENNISHNDHRNNNHHNNTNSNDESIDLLLDITTTTTDDDGHGDGNDVVEPSLLLRNSTRIDPAMEPAAAAATTTATTATTATTSPAAATIEDPPSIGVEHNTTDNNSNVMNSNNSVQARTPPPAPPPPPPPAPSSNSILYSYHFRCCYDYYYYYLNCFIHSTYPCLLLLMVLVLWPAGYFALHRLLTKTDSTFHSPIPGTPSAMAQQAFQHLNFSSSAAAAGTLGNASGSTTTTTTTNTSSTTSPTLLVVLHLKQQGTKNYTSSFSSSASSSLIDHSYARTSSLGLESYLNARVFLDVDNNNNNSKDNNDTSTTNNMIQVSSYYGFQHANLSLLSKSFLSKDEQTTFLQVTLLLHRSLEEESSLSLSLSSSSSSSSSSPSSLSTKNHHSSKQYLQALMDALDDYYYYHQHHVDHYRDDDKDARHPKVLQVATTTTTTSPPLPPPPTNDLEIGFTGLNYFSRDLPSSTQQDLKRMDRWVLPLALLLICITLLLQTTTTTTTTTTTPTTTPTAASIHSSIRNMMALGWMAPSLLLLPLLLLLPFCSMVSTVATWAIIMDTWVVTRMQITQFTPSIMMSLTLGMGMDYTLFLVSRYLLERNTTEAAAAAVVAAVPSLSTSSTTTTTNTSGGAVHDDATATATDTTFAAIQVMLEQGGKVVLVSGTTLLCTFLALVALPLPMLQSVGVGAAVAIASAMLMNLWVTPALLYFYSHYSSTYNSNYGCGFSQWLPTSQQQQEQQQEPHQQQVLEPAENGNDDPLLEPLLPLPSTTNDDHEDHGLTNSPFIQQQEQQQQQQQQLARNVNSNTTTARSTSIWIRLAKQVLHPYKSVIIVLIILQFLLWPVAWNARRLDSSDLSFESLLPKDSPSLQTYHRLIDGGHFGPGKLAPFRILLDGTRSNTTMDTAHAFDLQHDLVHHLLNTSTSASIVGATFVGISVANNKPIPYSVYAASKRCKKLQDCSNNDALRCLHFLDGQMLSYDRLATYFIVELEAVSPFDQDAIDWIDETRTQMDDWKTKMKEKQYDVDVYLDGTAAVAHDAVQAVYSSFPRVITSTLAVIFLLLGCVFRSVVPPLRSVVSITFTLTVSFGLAVLVYQDGIWDSFHIRALTAVDPELCWLVPIMSFSIIVGLALDYDVFLVTRILEYRQEGGTSCYGHESSIAAGLESTGGIITSAGLIMALSFGSLLGSQSTALDQWAFLVTTAVLLDTFVVRTILVPAMMGWTGRKYSWWPSTMPSPTVRLDGFDLDLDLDHLEGDDDAEVDHFMDEESREETLADLLLAEEDSGGLRPTERRETVYFEAVERPEDLGLSPDAKGSSTS